MERSVLLLLPEAVPGEKASGKKDYQPEKPGPFPREVRAGEVERKMEENDGNEREKERREKALLTARLLADFLPEDNQGGPEKPHGGEPSVFS